MEPIQLKETLLCSPAVHPKPELYWWMHMEMLQHGSKAGKQRVQVSNLQYFPGQCTLYLNDFFACFLDFLYSRPFFWNWDVENPALLIKSCSYALLSPRWNSPGKLSTNWSHLTTIFSSTSWLLRKCLYWYNAKKGFGDQSSFAIYVVIGCLLPECAH